MGVCHKRSRKQHKLESGTHEPPISPFSISTSTLPSAVPAFPNPSPNRPPKLTPAPPTIVTESVRPSACWLWNFWTAVAADSGTLNIIRMVTLSGEDGVWSFEDRIAPQRLNIALRSRLSDHNPSKSFLNATDAHLDISGSSPLN